MTAWRTRRWTGRVPYSTTEEALDPRVEQPYPTTPSLLLPVPRMAHLTERQSECLGLIVKSIEERGFPPSLREIGRDMGIKTPNGVLAHLQALVNHGAIERDASLSRGIRVICHDKTDHAPCSRCGGTGHEPRPETGP